MADRSGQQLGNYRLLRLLGRGGFAEVYLGQHIYLGSQAALKVLSQAALKALTLVLTDADTAQFAKEARTLASLNHPHIIRVLDFAIENSTPFLVMEYATNGTLRQLHPQNSRLPTETVITYIRQIASALQYAHDQHLIHRDVKPENMLLGSNGEILVSDFGLAMLAPRAIDYSTQVMEPPMVGTTSYAAPEQLQGRPQPASDQYSLGVVVYEWLSGKQPFSGSAFEIAMQHVSVPPPPLHEYIPGISPALEEVVMRVLAKEPSQRFASIQDFASALQRAYQYTLLPRSFFAPSEEVEDAEAFQTILKPGPMWKVPTIFTPLIGRENEVAESCALLKEPAVRLITLLGTGGIGKTRLSFQLAREIQPYFADGICFVSLASVNQPDLVVPTIARELGIQRIGTQPIFEQVKVALHNRHFLLILDNFEQVVAAAPLIEELLAACPRLKVVVTSRAVLHLAAEHEFPVPPLDLPDLDQLPEDAALTQYAAIALFVQRAKAILPKFRLTQDNARAIAEICVRLDGLPLAIELAAGHIKLLPPHILLARLPQLFQSSSGTSRSLPPRHQTLRNALQWSYNLLDAQEQQLFRRLSIFIGWTLEAVEAMETMLNTSEHNTLSTMDRVSSLLDKSLLVQRVEEGQEPRLLMLRTVREYALELLRESGEMEQCQHAHALYFLTLVEQAEAHLKGPQQTTWLVQLERERGNLRVALAWLIKQKETELVLRLCAALWRFWHLRGYWSEGRRWLEAALGLAQNGEPTVARAKALCAAGDLAYYQDDYGAARPLLDESVILCRKLDIKRELATALGALGILLDVQGDHAAARPLLEESERLCRTTGTRWELALLLPKLGQRAVQAGDLTRAAALTHEALTLAQALGDKSLIATAFSSLASLVALQGDQAQAMTYDRECLRLARELGDKYLTAITLQNLGYTAALQGDMTQAVVRAQEGLVLARELGDKRTIDLALHSLGYIAALQGNTKQASASYREGLSLAQEIGDERQVGWHLIGLATVAAVEEQPVRAARLFGAAATRLDVNVSMNDMERADYERTVESIRNKLDHRTFQAAWAEGRTMTPEQVLAAPEPSSVVPPPVRISFPPTPVYPDGLTAREVEVLRFLASGQTVAQIALQLVVSPRTVSTHITSIYRKIQVQSRSAATRYAIDHNLV